MNTVRLVLLVTTALLFAGPARALLVRARWTERAPRGAILLWQALGAAIMTCLVGSCVLAIRLAQRAVPSRREVTDFNSGATAVTPSQGMTPEQLFMLTAILIVFTLVAGAIVARLVSLARARARKRLLIDLLSNEGAELAGALVVASPQAAAFTLPGIRSRVVVSTGALATLEDDELACVLAHEQAHVRARHDLVLLPFRALAAVVPSSRALARARDEIAALVEMAADNRVRRDLDPSALARALCRLAISAESEQVLGSSAGSTVRRVEHALAAPSPAPLLACSVTFAAAAVIALPVAAMLAPIAR